MINLLPEAKQVMDRGEWTETFQNILLIDAGVDLDKDLLLDLARLRFWNYHDIEFSFQSDGMPLYLTQSLDDYTVEQEALFKSQGYVLNVAIDKVNLCFASKAGYINALTSLKLLVEDLDAHVYRLPVCKIIDYPSLAIRAIAQTFSWYAGYGRIGFDSQLWGYDEWAEYLNICLDNKINQFNLVMYGYWPFDFPEYPETCFRNVALKIWNAENRRWLRVHYTHPNLEEPFMDRFIELAHKLEVKIFAYVGLNSYNGAYSIKHPEARMIPPPSSAFLNDFDSLCLSYPGSVDYIVKSMERMVQLGFDGFTLEESEEGFWFCECEKCKTRWHAVSSSPGEAKHKANMWLLTRIWDAVKKINPEAVIGIRAFRQPPLEKDPKFLEECVASMPKGIKLFWAPGLYVPEGEFDKWCAAFGKENIWGRDTEANSITSTMGRLYRTFKSNILRYEDESNEQVIESDIRQHRGSVARGVHGINGFMFEWYGLFMHLFAHGNYGWGSSMDEETFYKNACELNFGADGQKVLDIMQNMLSIHESQIPLYTTPFPFQKNKIAKSDIARIQEAQALHPLLMAKIRDMQARCEQDNKMAPWRAHFDKLANAERRNAVIYELVLAALRYEEETDPIKKDKILDEILFYNEQDFAIAKEMFFDLNPVSESGVKSCMFPYHEMKRLIHNIRHPENPDGDMICSGIEALGWLWL